MLASLLISFVFLVSALSTTWFAAFLASSRLVGTKFSIAVLPAWPSLVAPSLVVALAMLSLAVLAASVALLTKSCFSWFGRASCMLILLVFLVNALSTTWFAAFLASSRLVGTKFSIAVF